MSLEPGAGGTPSVADSASTEPTLGRALAIVLSVAFVGLLVAVALLSTVVTRAALQLRDAALLSPDVLVRQVDSGEKSFTLFDRLGYDARPADPGAVQDVRDRVTRAYPGWRLESVTVETFDIEADGPPYYHYVARIRPPGRDFAVGVTFGVVSDGSLPPGDEILAVDGTDHHLADELLDMLEKNYFAHGVRDVIVTSGSGGMCFVDWVKGEGTTAVQGVDTDTYNVRGEDWFLNRDPDW